MNARARGVQDRACPDGSAHRCTLYSVNTSGGFATFLIRKAHVLQCAIILCSILCHLSNSILPQFPSEPGMNLAACRFRPRVRACLCVHTCARAMCIYLPSTLGLLTTQDVQGKVGGSSHLRSVQNGAKPKRTPLAPSPLFSSQGMCTGLGADRDGLPSPNSYGATVTLKRFNKDYLY